MTMSKRPVRYHVLHATYYDYGSPVSLSQQQLHLAPRVLAWQQVEEQRIVIEPEVQCDESVNRATRIAIHAHVSSFISCLVARSPTAISTGTDPRRRLLM